MIPASSVSLKDLYKFTQEFRTFPGIIPTTLVAGNDNRPAGNIFTPRRETPGGISLAIAGKTGPVPAGEREPYGQVPAPGRQLFFSAAIFFLVVSPVRYYICRKFNSVKKMISCK